MNFVHNAKCEDLLLNAKLALHEARCTWDDVNKSPFCETRIMALRSCCETIRLLKSAIISWEIENGDKS